MGTENYVEVIEGAGERVRELATTVAENEAMVRPYLDTLTEKSLTGETEALHESLRGFRETNETLFGGLLLTLHRPEEFLEEAGTCDVPDDVVDSLEVLASSYGHLSDAFEVVHVENRYGIRNGSPGLSTSRAYNRAENLPLMECTVRANGVDVGEFRVPPSQAVGLALSLLAHAGYVTRDTAQADQDVAAPEIELTRERIAELEDALGDTKAILGGDNVERAKTAASPAVDEDTHVGSDGVVDERDGEADSEDDPTSDESYHYFH